MKYVIISLLALAACGGSPNDPSTGVSDPAVEMTNPECKDITAETMGDICGLDLGTDVGTGSSTQYVTPGGPYVWRCYNDGGRPPAPAYGCTPAQIYPGVVWCCAQK